jgi:catechol 2,3-dioxygenase-like lactoylglutathione lyase family enzyme
MAVLTVLSLTLEVPDLQEGIRFYRDAGLIAATGERVATFRCSEHARTSIELVGGHTRKRLHHIAFRATNLDDIAARASKFGGSIAQAPTGFAQHGLWIQDPHGMLIHLEETEANPPVVTVPPFEINAPGRIKRIRQSAMLPVSRYAPIQPLKLGHVLLFSPNVPSSVDFMIGALGMGLADKAQDVIAFCCARKNSDHHVVAFAKSAGIGFHHASFQVATPDDVGRGGRALVAKSNRGDWGFGRHTIGSNFFHYIQDPWGSWFEYYSDMDFIDDHSLWTPTNYGMEDSLANWGPPVPQDFVHNYEIENG